MATQEQKKDYKVVKDFVGINTKANRTAIKEEEFSWLENAMPIGHANVRVVPAPSTVAGVTFAASVVFSTYGNLGTTNYYLAFLSDGSAVQVKVSDGTKTTIGAASTFSTSGVEASQWNNTLIIIIDPSKGYFQWDGTNLVHVGSLTFSFGLINYPSQMSLALTGVAITGVAGQFSCTAVTAGTLINGMAVTISGTLGGTGSITGYSNPTTYYIIATNGTTTFTLSASSGGSAITTTAGTPTGLTYTLTAAGYTAASTATVAVPNDTGGTRAVISLAISGGVISGVSAYGTGLTPGTGYTAIPTVTLAGPGVGLKITAALISQVGSAIASFSGRVWIANGRTLYFTAAGTNNDFYSTSTGNIIFNDSTLVGNITQIISANNFLYVFGVDSINVISDVRVNSSGTTLFTNTNISASVGTDLPYAMMPYFRSIVFMNRYGVYALVGSTTSKLSDALDGVFPYIDFTKNVSAGQVLVYNILCAAFNFYVNSSFPYGSGGARWLQAVYFDKKWFFTSQNAVTFVSSIPINGSAVLFSTTGTDLQKTYQDSTAAISSYIQPALYGMGNIIRDKVALKFGVEAILPSDLGNNMTVTVDSENATSPSITLTNFQYTDWVNNSGSVVSWNNSLSQVVYWGNATNGYYLYRYNADMWGKYISLTITSSSPNWTMTGIQFETELRARF
jgi:hypothetical protein